MFQNAYFVATVGLEGLLLLIKTLVFLLTLGTLPLQGPLELLIGGLEGIFGMSHVDAYQKS